MFSFPICQVTAPYLHIGGVVLMTLLSWPIALHVFRFLPRGKDEFLGIKFISNIQKEISLSTLMHLISQKVHIFMVNSLPVFVSVRGMAITVLYITVLVTLFLVPLGMYSPCIKERSSLGSAPALIGHRGAPMVHVIILRLFRFKHQPLNTIFFSVLICFVNF